MCILVAEDHPMLGQDLKRGTAYQLKESTT